MQAVHDEVQSPGTLGCRSTHPIRQSPLCPCLASEAGDDEYDGACHGGPQEDQRGEELGLGEAQEKNGVGQGLVVGSVGRAALAQPYGLQGSR